MIYKTGTGKVLNAHEWAEYRRGVYDFLFYVEKKWGFDGSTQFFRGQNIHYSDFQKAKRGTL